MDGPLYLISYSNYTEALHVSRQLGILRDQWSFIPLGPPTLRGENLKDIRGGYKDYFERLVGDFSDFELETMIKY